MNTNEIPHYDSPEYDIWLQKLDSGYLRTVLAAGNDVDALRYVVIDATDYTTADFNPNDMSLDELVDTLAALLWAKKIYIDRENLHVGSPQSWFVHSNAVSYSYGNAVRQSIETAEEEQSSRPQAALESPSAWLALEVLHQETAEPVKNVKIHVTVPEGSQAASAERKSCDQGKIDFHQLKDGRCQITSDAQNLHHENTVKFRKKLNNKPAAPKQPPAKTGDQKKNENADLAVVNVRHHKIKPGDTLTSIAGKYGLTESEISIFNWNSEDPKKINQAMVAELGGIETDNGEVIFINGMDHGELLIPQPWSLPSVHTGSTHYLGVTPVIAPMEKNAIYVPEWQTFITLSDEEYKQFRKDADESKKYADALHKATSKDKPDPQEIIDAKEKLADFYAKHLDKEKNVGPGGGAAPLLQAWDFKGKEYTFVTKNTQKILSDLKKHGPRRYFQMNKENNFKLIRDNRFRGSKELEAKEAVKKEKRATETKVDASASWEIYKDEGQVPIEKLLNNLGVTGPLLVDAIKKLDSDALVKFDQWVEHANKNYEWTLQDKDKRKKQLLYYIHPEKAAKAGITQPEEYKKLKATIEDLMKYFDDELFGKIKSEIEYIWSDDKEFLKEVNEEFLEDVKGFEADLDTSREELYDLIDKTDVPPFNVDCSAEAQFMRYGVSAGAASNVDLKKGIISANISGSLNFALAEGKVGGNLYLPDSKGKKFTIQVKNRMKWVFSEKHTTDIDEALTKATTKSTYNLNSSFLYPSDMPQLDVLSKTKEVLDILASGIKLQIVGSTDTSGSVSFNDKLSIERAHTAFQFWTFNPGAWLKKFLDMNSYDGKAWGTYEFQHMLAQVLGNLGRKVDLEVTGVWNKDWQKHLDEYESVFIHAAIKADFLHGNSIILQDQIPVNLDRETCILLKTDGTKPVSDKAQLYGKEHWSFEVRKIVLYRLIGHYMVNLGRSRKFLTQSAFMLTPYMGVGESESITKFNRADRKIMYFFYEGHQEKQPVDVELGHIRINIMAQLSGYVGANISASAEIGVNASKGKLYLEGLRKGQAKSYKPGKTEIDHGGSVSGEAFAGAKVSAQCKGILEWDAPEPPAKQDNKTCAHPVNIRCGVKKPKDWRNDIPKGFMDLASVGYGATASIGVSLVGEFKIGYDGDSGKFLIKAKAEASLGPGFGGAFEFAINAKHVYFFIRFVYDELFDNDFSFVDIFDDDEVFTAFVNWNWELLKSGHVVTSASMLAFGTAAISILRTTNIVKKFNAELEVSQETAKKIIEFVNNNLEFCHYLVPEVKARMLYVLTQGTAYFSSDEEIEDAIVKILSTIELESEYREVLEHMDFNVAKGQPLSKKSQNVFGAETNIRQALISQKGAAGAGLDLIYKVLDGEQEDDFEAWYRKLKQGKAKQDKQKN
ncbi:MAG: LysM peptidoglycan-binding domain-containing protein [Gammaproteobacteria bacterium]|nr:LysM peptidoglycan-binding domain-containing protein [Gammaproteobacteria bacterium]